MVGEPPLDPPEYDEGPEPTDQEWAEWRLRDMDYLVEDDDVIEACDKALRMIGESLINPGKKDHADMLAEVCKLLTDAVEAYARDGDMCEVGEWQSAMAEKAAEDFDEPDEPPYEPVHPMYDGTGNPYG